MFFWFRASYDSVFGTIVDKANAMNLHDVIAAWENGLARVCLAMLTAILVVGVGFALWRVVSRPVAAAWSMLAWGERFVAACLCAACILYGGDKLRSLPGIGGVPISVEEVLQGYRLENVFTNDAISYAMPTDGVEYARWTLRGGRDTRFALDLGDFAFPFGTGVVHCFDVLSGGTIESLPRPSVLAISAAREWASLVPGVCRFWWADAAGTRDACPYRAKLLTWENVYAGRDRMGQYSAQIELCDDGNFATRSNNVEHVYRRVPPFDWDDDGLENSVDPDPLVTGPDAHGTNAEWYNTVCSNVFYAVATSCDPPGIGGNPDPGTGGTQLVASVDLSWKEGVNSNAYYFVDIVAEKGPAPIYFTGGRTSRLGDPVVIALAGETNRVPLLVGIDYAVTSIVPFTVSFPMDYMYPEVETNEPCVARICWPLAFSVMPDGNGYRVVASPYDPGCGFQWPMPTRSVTCGYTTSGGWIGFDCGSGGNCGCGGCSATGSATLEDAEFEIPSVWCGCCNDGPADLGGGPGVPHTNGPSVSVSFDKSVVFYEDAYTNAPGDVVAKRSTKTTLSVSASAGEDGGMLYVTAENIGKLVRTGGKAITFPYTAYVPAFGGASFTIEYEAAEHSDSANDISVTASLQSAGTGTPISDSASATAVKVLLTALAQIPSNASRHVYGIRETLLCETIPALPSSVWRTSGTGFFSDGGSALYFICPILAAENCLQIVYGGSEYVPSTMIIEPNGIIAVNPIANDYQLPKGTAGGAGMTLQLHVLPMTVSFAGISMEEVPTTTGNHTGYFASGYWSQNWYHTRDVGAGDWTNIQPGNFFFEDTAELWHECAQPWQAGMIEWDIPIGWNERNTAGNMTPVKQVTVVYHQNFAITSDGSLSVAKLGHVVTRTTNDVIMLNGTIVKGAE